MVVAIALDLTGVVAGANPPDVLVELAYAVIGWQAGARFTRPGPQIEQGGDIQAGAESKLADGEPAPARPGLGKSATGQKHGPAFGQAVIAGKIHVAVEAGAR